MVALSASAGAGLGVVLLQALLESLQLSLLALSESLVLLAGRQARVGLHVARVRLLGHRQGRGERHGRGGGERDNLRGRILGGGARDGRDGRLFFFLTGPRRDKDKDETGRFRQHTSARRSCFQTSSVRRA
jgi:hypothetical protein